MYCIDKEAIPCHSLSLTSLKVIQKYPRWGNLWLLKPSERTVGQAPTRLARAKATTASNLTWTLWSKKNRKNRQVMSTVNSTQIKARVTLMRRLMASVGFQQPNLSRNNLKGRWKRFQACSVRKSLSNWSAWAMHPWQLGRATHWLEITRSSIWIPRRGPLTLTGTGRVAAASLPGSRGRWESHRWLLSKRKERRTRMSRIRYCSSCNTKTRRLILSKGNSRSSETKWLHTTRSFRVLPSTPT